MSSLSFHTYPGLGEENSNMFHYSQSARVGSTIRCSGQGGFNDKGEIIEPMEDQIRMAFKNVEKALQNAGGEGWSQMFKEFMPNHRPLWVAVGVAKLGEGMQVEIEVEALDDPTAWLSLKN